MQQVLNRPKAPASQENQQQSLQPPSNEANFIPTPDAKGVVANYEELYPPNTFDMSFTILRFSESVEECQKNGLATNRQYVLDERDAIWLEQWNREAKGEGTSTSSKDASEEKPVMSEDQFELVMGFFEKFASDHLPLLHAVCVHFFPIDRILTPHIEPKPSRIQFL